jgi:hypothetical protein
VQLAFDTGADPDLQGAPRRAIQIRMENSPGGTLFIGELYNNFQKTHLGNDIFTYDDFLIPDAARRDTFELRISKTHIRFGMPKYNRWWINTNIPALNWTQGVVQLGHHSYTPRKDDPVARENSWHWDNVTISPARAFTMIKTNRRNVNATRPGAVALTQPAPSGAFLRFAGIGEQMQVRFDNGPWTSARLQPTDSCCKTEHFKSYWMPIPAGTRQVAFRATNYFGNWPWEVRDISVWKR